MPNIDLSILNQRQTPAFFADTLANRPSAGFLGRIFVSTDTFAFYRDNGSGWDLIGGPGTGTITGSGASGQVSFWNGASTITGSNDLFWDSVNGHLGIGTITPSTALTIFHDQNQIIQLNQTTATNDTKIAFQNSGTPLWRIGNSYNAGANDYGIFDVVGAIQPLTIKKTTGQTFIGAQTTSSGRLVVNDATGDNHIVVIGATAPSLRINNSGSGATKQIGIGLATATNNFIQGAVDRDMTIFNGSTTPSPILFGIYDTTNIQEAARISAARNFLIGTTTDAGQKLYVNGTALINNILTVNNNIITSGQLSFTASTSQTAGSIARNAFYGLTLFGIAGTNSDFGLVNSLGNEVYKVPTGTINSIFSGNVGIGTTSPTEKLVVTGNIYTNGTNSNIYIDNGGVGGASLKIGVTGTTETYIYSLEANDPLLFGTNNTERLRISSSGNLLIGTTTDSGNKLQVNGTSIFRDYITCSNNANTYISIQAVGSGLTSYLELGGTNYVWQIQRPETSGDLIFYYLQGATDVLRLNRTGTAEFNSSIKTGAPSGGTAQFWKLGNYTAGVAVQAGKVRVEINGVAYDLLTA